MNDADLVKQINDSLSPGYEVCGYTTLERGDLYAYGNASIRIWDSPVTSVGNYLKVKKSFVWPEWLKGQAIANDGGKEWFVYEGMPRLEEGYWDVTGNGSCHRLPLDFLNIDLPEVNYKDSLILNPNHPENKA